MNALEILKIVQRYPEKTQILGGVSDEAIAGAEKQLNVRFPDSYKEFLRVFGWLGFVAEEFYGIGGSREGMSDPVNYTIAERKSVSDFSLDLVVIADPGSWEIYCLRTSMMNNEKECPVVSWVTGMKADKQPYEVLADSFEDYLTSAINTQLERIISTP